MSSLAPAGKSAREARHRILVVDDEPRMIRFIRLNLEHDGFEVVEAADGLAALKQVRDVLPDLILLDVSMPELDGFETLRLLREISSVPVIMLTARGDEDDRVVGLELGADDYVSKPFSPRELTARVKAVLRRAGARLPEAELPVATSQDGLEIDVAAREVRVRGQPATLTAREFELLVFLARSPRQVFRREELLEQVWGFTYGDTSTVTVHIRRLREKIEDDPSAPKRITTVWGVGYRWDG
jgi:DNA-binding response OmpR family regulator